MHWGRNFAVLRQSHTGFDLFGSGGGDFVVEVARPPPIVTYNNGSNLSAFTKITKRRHWDIFWITNQNEQVFRQIDIEDETMMTYHWSQYEVN